MTTEAMIRETERKVAAAIIRGIDAGATFEESSSRHFASITAEWPAVAAAIDPARVAVAYVEMIVERASA